MSAIRLGNFKVTNLKEAVQFGEVYRLYIPFTENYVAKDRSLIVALLRIQKVEGFEHDRLLYKLDRFGIKIPQLASTKAYIRFLEDVYNFKQKTDRIRFF